MLIECPKCKELVDSEEERCLHCGASFREDGSNQLSDVERATYGYSNNILNRFDLGIDKKDFKIVRTGFIKNAQLPPKLINVILLFGAFWVLLAILVFCFLFLLHVFVE